MFNCVISHPIPTEEFPPHLTPFVLPRCLGNYSYIMFMFVLGKKEKGEDRKTTKGSACLSSQWDHSMPLTCWGSL